MNLPFRSRRGHRGVAAVEFAAGSLFFFAFVFGLIELTRALYLRTTMIEVTRRAARMAADTDLVDSTKMSNLRINAMFGPSGVPLAGVGLNHNNLAIDYLNAQRQRVDPKHCAAQNLINCSTNPEGANCIRFVRARLCTAVAGATCTRVDYVPMMGTGFFPTGWKHPTFTTVTPVGTLGHIPGVTANCP